MEIIMLYVIQEIPIPATFTAFTISSRISRPGKRITFREYHGELNSEMKASASKMLNKKIEKYKNRKDEGVQVTIKSKTTDGCPTEKIIEFAYKEGVDLIIMGRTGLAGFAKIKALGSVARNVSEKAKCPVMLVR
jgi:nucleotide-binding universal stress UspA family protein